MTIDVSATETSASEQTDLENGRDELNLASYSVGTMLRYCPIQTETHKDRQGNKHVLYFKKAEFERRDGKTKKMIPASIKVSTKTPDGFPNQEDEENLLTFLCHGVISNQQWSEGIKYNHDDIFNLRNATDGGNNYAALSNTVDRYFHAEFEYVNCWYDSRTKDFLPSIAFRMIAERGQHRKKYGQSSPASFFTWTPSFQKILHSSNIKQLNLREMLSLPRGAARDAYRYIDKRYYRGKWPKFTAGTEEFARVCGLRSQQNPSRVKQTLTRILQQLQKQGCLHSFSFEPVRKRGKRVAGEWTIHFQKTAAPPLSQNQDQARQMVELFQEKFPTDRRRASQIEIDFAAKIITRLGPIQPVTFVMTACKVLRKSFATAQSFNAISKYEDEIIRLYRDRLPKQPTLPLPEESLQQPERVGTAEDRAARVWAEWRKERRDGFWKSIRANFPDADAIEQNYGDVRVHCLAELVQRIKDPKMIIRKDNK